ncbi:TrkH family potassium uptake protein [Maritalea mediterranea]|uniref:Trk system potassium uptake protein n=1 Tax=Maritalea mediterranea TaxID=2909667 RepID=A0ABS9E818_9HYPH|nr:TrkH family potassium uptake protein [Maritalea mediterranea]MCF4097591.1 TrkH family potassium uptake protein [Maritalea mediterranea]
MEFRPILMIIGVLTAILGCSMFLPAIADALVGNDDWIVFVTSGLITTLLGAGTWAASFGHDQSLNARQAFFMTAIIWVVLAVFGALPFYWAGINLSYTDAFFESMSGLTTTGATVISGLDTLPPGILLWRSLLQWFGGLGIIVMAVAVLPMLQIGGMQMFKAEAFDTAEKILPRAAQIASNMTTIYITLTFACAVCYWAAGMGLFDAIAHSMTTVATGGFSTRDGSIASFGSAVIDYIAVSFMILGALPFLIYVKMVRGNLSSLWRDSQVRAFLLVLGAVTLVAIIVQYADDIARGEVAFRHAIFSVTSVMTGTGYATTDYGSWGGIAISLFFIITFIGGCAGSTSCGIKIFRFQVLFLDLKQHIKQILYPSGVFVKRYNGQIISDTVSASVMSFIFLYFFFFIILALLLSLTGLDSLTAFSGAATAISNVGPGLGDIIGPSGNFGPLSDLSKWLIAIGMIVGRLEIFTVLVLFLPRFWRG